MQRPIALRTRRDATAAPRQVAVRALAGFLRPFALLPLRLFFGVTFVYAGWQKFTDAQYLDPAAAGYVGVLMAAFAEGAPIRRVRLHLALPHAAVLGALLLAGWSAVRARAAPAAGAGIRLLDGA